MMHGQRNIKLCRSCFNINFNILLKQFYFASFGK